MLTSVRGTSEQQTGFYSIVHVQDCVVDRKGTETPPPKPLNSRVKTPGQSSKGSLSG